MARARAGQAVLAGQVDPGAEPPMEFFRYVPGLAAT